MRSTEQHNQTRIRRGRVTSATLSLGLGAVAAIVAMAAHAGSGVADTGIPVRGVATGCIERPHCSMSYGWDDANDPLQQQLGCGGVFTYFNGANSGVLGGTGSFCADTPANRATLHDQKKRGFQPAYCETCMGVPDHKLFVFWGESVGPSCPSGCVLGVSAPAF